MDKTSSEEETQWTDDQIRWTEKENKTYARDDDESDGVVDIFRQDPKDSFSFSFPLSSEKETIDIELEGYTAESDEIWQSTGLTLWKASEHLCHYLLKHQQEYFPSSEEPQRVLELGAGLGLVGILVHLMVTNATVCLTDGDTNALKYLRDNVQRNTTSDNISCHQLLWGHESATLFLEKGSGEKFDVIMASDILYAECVVKPLWETVRVVLSRPNGVFVMAFAKRKVKVTIDNFIRAAQDDFTHKCVEQDEEKQVFVYEFRWKDGEK